MSGITNITQTGNQLHTSYDVSKLFLGENERISGTYASTPEITLAAGLVVGQIAATGALVAYDNSASDGSQYPAGIVDLGISESVVIAAEGSKVLNLVNKGRVAEAKVTFPGVITLDSVISGDTRTVRQYMNAMGIIFEGGEELTKLDNQ